MNSNSISLFDITKIYLFFAVLEIIFGAYHFFRTGHWAKMADVTADNNDINNSESSSLSDAPQSTSPPVTDASALPSADAAESAVSSETEGPDTHSIISSSGETGGPDSDFSLR